MKDRVSEIRGIPRPELAEGSRRRCKSPDERTKAGKHEAKTLARVFGTFVGTKVQKKMKKKLILIVILAFLGFVDSAYLTIVHYKNIIPPCSITQGCEKVLASNFSTILGIPLALFGSLFFILIFVLAVLSLQTGKEAFKKSLRFFSTLGLIAGIVLFYIQWKILFAFCQYCLLVEAIILAIFILSFFFKEKSGKQGENISQRTGQ